MEKAGLLGACWPSPLQEQALRAAVLEPPAGAAAWAGLRADIALDDIWDPEVHRLLPQVHANLVAAGVASPDLPRLKGIRRRSWYDTQLRLHRARPALDSLTAAGIPLLFLKGVPLALQYFRDVGLRPMQDVDVLVPRAHADHALDVLEAAGWRDAGGIARAQLWRTHHGSGLHHPDGGDLDVHWHLGTPLVLPADEARSTDDFWAAAVPFDDDAHGLHGLTLCPSDMLLHVIAHGLWAGSASTVRWVSDAHVVVREQPIEWDRLVDQATRRRIAPLVADALRYLRDEMAAPIPPEAVSRLDAVPMTRRERRLLGALVGPINGPAVLGGLPHLRSYWAYTRLKWGPARAARELPGFLAELWHLDSPWQLPAGAVRRARTRLTERLPQPSPASAPPGPPPTVAVVVPTHHRPDDLTRCLDALLAQRDAPEEIIVVRGRTDDDAAAVVAGRGDRVTEVVTDRTTQVERLHAGAAVAGSDVVAFTDDDAAPHPDWVQRLRAHLSDSTVGAVGGRDRHPDDATHRAAATVGTLGWGGRLIGGHSDGRGAARDVQHLRGVNLAVRRRLLRFPAGLRGPGAQGYNELPLCLWVLDSGHRVVYDPDLVVDHHLAPRYEHGDGHRDHAAPAKRADDAFNQTYALLSLRPERRWARMGYVVLVGDRSTGGLLRGAVAALTGDRRLVGEVRPLLHAQLDAWRAVQAAPLRSVRPDDPFPDMTTPT